MKILAHRGYWEKPEEKNTLGAVYAAMEHGYGFESDIRDYCGKLVISHDIASVSSPEAEDVIKALQKYQDKFCFAINIKADGLEGILKQLLEYYHISNYFTFDMSVPQMAAYAQAGLNFFTRKSEFETEPAMYQKASGVWVDAFEDASFITEGLLHQYIHDGKTVCLVSPDLHGRPCEGFWGRLKKFEIDFSSLYLCTDKPDAAKEFFEKELDGNNDKSSNF